jgi:hypothetical protein
MKKIILIILTTAILNGVFAQKEEGEEKQKGFKKENLFAGGSATLSFYNGGSVMGVNPYFGYSLNRFMDVALVANFTYTGARLFSGEKIRQYVYGPGAFLRIYPIKFIFLHASVEHNFLSVKYIPPSGSGFPIERFKEQSNSVLLGGGYCSGRQGIGDFFYYFSVMLDVTKDPNSPYVELLQDGTFRAIPIIRGGIQIPLFTGKRGRFGDN